MSSLSLALELLKRLQSSLAACYHAADQEVEERGTHKPLFDDVTPFWRPNDIAALNSISRSTYTSSLRGGL